MADELPAVEIAPTVIISNSEDNSNEPNEHEINSGNASDNASGNADLSPASEQVAIATIEAERDIALAAIDSDVERERIAVEAERVEAIAEHNTGIEECRNEIQRLAGIVEALTEQVNSLTPPTPLVEEAITEELPIAPETDLIQPSTAVPTAETQTEHSEESVEERAEEAIAKPVHRFIAI